MATVSVAVLAKQAVGGLWKEAADKICRSPERSDLRMSQEEAQGWLIGALFGRELLPDEARAVGKRVNNYAAAEDKAQRNAKEKAKSKNKEARKAADPEPKLAAIERGLAAKRDERLARAVDLGLPPANAVIVASRPEPEEKSELTLLLERDLKAEVAELEEESKSARIFAEAAASRAKRLVDQFTKMVAPSEWWVVGAEYLLKGAQYPDSVQRRREAAQ